MHLIVSNTYYTRRVRLNILQKTRTKFGGFKLNNIITINNRLKLKMSVYNFF